jgi:hypothetical protein
MNGWEKDWNKFNFVKKFNKGFWPFVNKLFNFLKIIMKIFWNILMILGWLWFLPKLILNYWIYYGLCTRKEDLFTGLFWICDTASMVSLIQMILSMFWIWFLVIIFLWLWIIFWWINLYETKKYLSFSSILLYITSIFFIFIIINNFILH